MTGPFRPPAAAAAALLLSLAACSSSRPPWAEGQTVEEVAPADAAPQDLGRLEARLLAAHNRERAASGAPPLRWDSALAGAAAGYAAVLAERGRLAHSPPASRPGQGENLWMGTRGAYQLEEMAGHWAAEKALRRPGTFPNVSRSGQWSDVAHYTQMIWRGTDRVGCALHQSRTSDILVCRYAPPGNVVGEAVP
jgi:Cysteine-rich secretory protein family